MGVEWRAEDAEHVRDILRLYRSRNLESNITHHCLADASASHNTFASLLSLCVKSLSSSSKSAKSLLNRPTHNYYEFPLAISLTQAEAAVIVAMMY